MPVSDVVGRVGRALLLAVAGAGASAACGLVAPCHPATASVEVRYDSPFYEAQVRLLETYQRTGWACARERSLWDFRGDELGVRYRCTQCA